VFCCSEKVFVLHQSIRDYRALRDPDPDPAAFTNCTDVQIFGRDLQLYDWVSRIPFGIIFHFVQFFFSFLRHQRYEFEVNRNRQSTDFEFPLPSLEDGGAVSKREYLWHQRRKQTTTCRGACD
jgi:hypothetical protein